MVRGIMTLLLGGWLLGTLVVAGVATGNFRMIDLLLNSPSHPVFQKDMAQLPSGEGRVLLRYLASELNRFYFRAWGGVEVALGGCLFGCVLWGLQERKLIVGFSLMLVIVAINVFFLAPELVEVGRSLDFVPRQPPPAGMATFARLHAAYSILDLIQFLLGLWMAVILVRLQARPGRNPGANR